MQTCSTMENGKQEIPCEATLLVRIDKETMKCLSTSLVLDVEDLNVALAQMDSPFEVLGVQIDMDGFRYDRVELSLPEV